MLSFVSLLVLLNQANVELTLKKLMFVRKVNKSKRIMRQLVPNKSSQKANSMIELTISTRLTSSDKVQPSRSLPNSRIKAQPSDAKSPSQLTT